MYIFCNSDKYMFLYIESHAKTLWGLTKNVVLIP